MPDSAPSRDSSAGTTLSETESPVQDLHETTEPRVFTVVRGSDESGVSGTGRVLDGCVFHNGQVVVCWRGDINSEKSGYSSLAIYPCWEAFQRVHIDSHPSNETEVVFGANAGLLKRITDCAAQRGEAERAGTERAGEDAHDPAQAAS